MEAIDLRARWHARVKVGFVIDCDRSIGAPTNPTNATSARNIRGSAIDRYITPIAVKIRYGQRSVDLQCSWLSFTELHDSMTRG
jgi:hypothetical protein